jgi:dihydroorotase
MLSWAWSNVVSNKMTTKFPALIDCHVHFREPGLEHKADMASEGLAAFHGGIRTVCEMPNTNPATNSIAALTDKVERAKRIADKCDIRFYFGATTSQHVAELEALWTKPEHEALKKRCSGLKLYLDNSTGNMKADESVVEEAFVVCGRLRIPLVAHCECSCINNEAADAHPATTVEAHSKRRPEASEVTSIRNAIALAEKHSTLLHVAHLSTAGGLELVRDAKKRSMPVTCEVTPHHLFLTTADYPELQSRIKVNPPIRTHEKEHLWVGLLDGTIDCVATDHAPHLMEEKALGPEAPSGMPGVEVVLPLMISVVAGHWPHPTAPPPACLASAEGGIAGLSFEDLKRLMFTNPNRIFSLGCDAADVMEVTTDGESILRNEEMHSKCKWTPYHDWKVKGAWRRI